MHSIAQLLDEKGRTIYSVRPDQKVYEAIVEMAERGIGALLVMEGDQLAGMLSERDYARKVILKGKSSKETSVREIMTPEVITVAQSDTVDACLQLMSENRIRHLPVVEDGKVVGVLSIGDLVKCVISDQKQQIESLERYVVGEL